MSTILIADDEANIVMLLEIVLKDLEADIITAENGEIAVEKAKKYKPDLIITDVVMPKMNGFEVCRAIRNTEGIQDTPIVILSALGDEYNKITGFEEGADDYVIKPFNVEELKARAKTLLMRHHAKKAANTALLSDLPEKDPPKDTGTSTFLEKTPFSTGQTLLDKHLFGGLPQGSNILIQGELGKGKSSFARQFIQEGLVKGEKCLWIAIDDDPKRIRETLCQDLPNDAAYYEERHQLRFVDAYSWSSLTQPEGEAFAVTGSLELNQFAGIISDASHELGQTVQHKKGGRRVVDSISSLFINFDLASVQRFLSQIARTAVAFGGVTTLFLIEEGTVDEKVLNNIKYVMDGILELDERDGQRMMRVASMKWTKYNNQWIPLHPHQL